ncbi:hypothetical protein BDZ89DRAFT_1216568 [Hymenopellis radicata]|nr:hypothetical protein BDZ89DRAFT_1216568 [Hymenopellis radicata]
MICQIPNARFPQMCDSDKIRTQRTLNCEVMEPRMDRAAPSLLERVVPTSVSRFAPGNKCFDLKGFVLPSATVVATQAWSTHRHPLVARHLPSRPLVGRLGICGVLGRHESILHAVWSWFKSL